MTSSPSVAAPVPAEQVDAVLAATQVVGGLIAESLAAVQPAVTVPQWRVLVLASRGSSNVSAVAEDLGVHASNATRICDRLVALGLLSRRRSPDDRRHVLLVLTEEGQRFVEEAMGYRRDRVEQAMARLAEDHREVLADALSEFASALSVVHGEAAARTV